MSTLPQGRIQVVGLGPGDPGSRTIAGQRALDEATRIVLRTRIHPGLDDLRDDSRVTDCDDLYETQPSFDAIYTAISERLCEIAQREESLVVFAVPGHPRFGERSVTLLEQHAALVGVAIEVQTAVSALDVVATVLAVDPLASEMQLIDGPSLAAIVDQQPYAGGRAGFDPRRPLLIGQVYSPAAAAAAKLGLSRVYPDEHRVAVVRAAGVLDAESIFWCPLFELDRQEVDHLTSVWVPPLDALEAYRHPQTLTEIIARLRAPSGCPWDREQTHASLRPAVIEEAYETVDAIDANDPENLAEELGDLILQVALHAQIAEEAGDFSVEDIYEQVNRKLIRRHPHVFAGEKAETPSDVVTTWEQVKARERAQSINGRKPSQSRWDRLPRSMPALTKASAVLRSKDIGQNEQPSAAEVAGSGRALLAVVEDLCRRGIDPELALNAALERHLTSSLAGALTDDEQGRDGE